MTALFEAQEWAIHKALAAGLNGTLEAFEGDRLTIVERPEPNWGYVVNAVAFAHGTWQGRGLRSRTCGPRPRRNTVLRLCDRKHSLPKDGMEQRDSSRVFRRRYQLRGPVCLI